MPAVPSEKNVLERTNDLALADDALRREIGLRRQVEKALLEMTESEMRSIGHDLHDGLCQQLAGIMCLCGTTRDITERKRIEEELKRSHEEPSVRYPRVRPFRRQARRRRDS